MTTRKTQKIKEWLSSLMQRNQREGQRRKRKGRGRYKELVEMEELAEKDDKGSEIGRDDDARGENGEMKRDTWEIREDKGIKRENGKWEKRGRMNVK